MTTDECEYLVRVLVDYWKPRLGLHTWTILVSTSSRITTDDGKWFTAAALAWTKWDYLQARLRFSTDYLCDMNASEVEETVVHELLHCVLAELRAADDQHEERVATLLARSLVGQYA